jgi:Ca2+-binding RTX toxin-like protein
MATKDDFSNNTATTGTLVIPATGTSSVAGVTEKAGDHDWFKVTLTAGKHYVFAFDEFHLGSANSLIIHDAAGQALQADHFNEFMYGASVSFFTPKKSGIYYVDALYGLYTYPNNYTVFASEKKSDDYGDFINTAHQINLIADQAISIKGQIETKYDQDWFKVTLLAGKTYYFSHNENNKLLSPHFDLYAKSGNEIYLDYDFYHKNSEFYTVSHSDTYYLKVTDFWGRNTGSYQFNISPPPDDYPDHVSNLKPVVIGNAANISRHNDFAGDHDWIPVQLTAGKSYVTQGTIDLRNAQGQLIPHGENKGSNVTFSALHSGLYYLDVLDSPIPFKITAYRDDYAGNVDSNGYLRSPNLQGVSIRGAIEVVGDHDWIKVPLVAGSPYLFVVNPTGTQTTSEFPTLHLYDATGKLIPTHTGQAISFTAPSSGNYYLDVAGAVKENIYSVATDAQYKGTYAVSAGQINDDYGNTLATAGKLNLSSIEQMPSHLTGHIEADADHDWVAVHLLAHKTYRFTLNDVASKLSTFGLALLDAKGILINTGIGDGGESGFTATYMPTHSGTYYLDISAIKTDVTGYYAVQIQHIKDDYPGHITDITPLKPGVAVEGQSNFTGDHDWLPFQVEAGKTYHIFLDVIETYSLDDDPNMNPPPSIGIFVIRDADGVAIPNGNSVFKEGAHYFQFTAPKSGLFYADIALESYEFSGRDSSTFFGLAIDAHRDDYTADTSTLGKLALSANMLHTVTGSWENIGATTASDADWFKVSLQAGQHYIFALNIHNTLGYTNNLSVLDANGKAINSVTASDNSVSFVAASTGSYYLSVNNHLKDTQYDGAVHYTLSGQQGVAMGSAGIDILTGGSNADLLYGRNGDDTFNGRAGDDILNGGAGKDIMRGGYGNDSYYVDNPSDIIKETSSIPTEIDTIYSTSNYRLPANVENLVLQRTEGKDIFGIGNNLNNTLTAQSYVKQTLRGGQGNDTVISQGNLVTAFGDAGNDSFIGSGHFIGGSGKDNYNLNGKYDSTITIAKGDSLPTGFDVIQHFSLLTIYPDRYDYDYVVGDTLDLTSKNIASDVASANGKNSGLLHSHHINQGLISFDNLDFYKTPLEITANQISDAIKYLQINITKLGDTVAFVANSDTYVFQNNGITDTLVKLTGIVASGLDNTYDPYAHNMIGLR